MEELERLQKMTEEERLNWINTNVRVCLSNGISSDLMPYGEKFKAAKIEVDNENFEESKITFEGEEGRIIEMTLLQAISKANYRNGIDADVIKEASEQIIDNGKSLVFVDTIDEIIVIDKDGVKIENCVVAVFREGFEKLDPNKYADEEYKAATEGFFHNPEHPIGGKPFAEAIKAAQDFATLGVLVDWTGQGRIKTGNSENNGHER